MDNQSIYVTKTFLPPLEDYLAYLKDIWDRNQITNNGPFVKELEEKLAAYLQVKHMVFVTNGTIALQIGLKALGLTGEIITTPFSYVATTSIILWEGCTPVFADIDPNTLCIDPEKIEEAITEKTSGILATHVYGIPCEVEKIQEIATRHNLKVIYDAAHTFGVNYNARPLVNYGDISTLSFHATKLFHTIEGGGIIANDDELAHRVSYMRNFGHRGQEDFWGVGINGKATELNAAMGLCMLPYVDDIILARKQIFSWYDEIIKNLPLSRPPLPAKTTYNYAYYPVIFENESAMLKAKTALNEVNIFPRRYFYPSLNQLPYVQYLEMPVSEDMSKRVLCLPLSADLSQEEVILIVDKIKKAL